VLTLSLNLDNLSPWLLAKYGKSPGQALYRMFMTLSAALPLAALVAGAYTRPLFDST
jgi:hypothetical protein